MSEHYRIIRLLACAAVVVLGAAIGSMLAGSIHADVAQTNIATAKAAEARADADKAMFGAMAQTAEQKPAGAK